MFGASKKFDKLSPELRSNEKFDIHSGQDLQFTTGSIEKKLIPAFLSELKLPNDDVIEHKRTHLLALNYTPKSQFFRKKKIFKNFKFFPKKMFCAF